MNSKRDEAVFCEEFRQPRRVGDSAIVSAKLADQLAKHPLGIALTPASPAFQPEGLLSGRTFQSLLSCATQAAWPL